MTSTDIVKWRKTNDYENFEQKNDLYENFELEAPRSLYSSPGYNNNISQ
jgi:hypothetical protein